MLVEWSKPLEDNLDGVKLPLLSGYVFKNSTFCYLYHLNSSRRDVNFRLSAIKIFLQKKFKNLTDKKDTFSASELIRRL